MIGPAHVVALALVMAGTSGCTLLDLLLAGGAPPFPDDSFPIPSAIASFTSGSATLRVGDETIILDELVGASGVDADIGLHASWESDDGWYVTVYAYPDAPFSSGAYLSIDRITGNEHWVIVDPSRCVATTDQADETGVQGSAVCLGLRWADYFDYSVSGFPKPLPSQEPFDAEITFQAH